MVWRRLKTWATHTVKDRKKHALTIQNIQHSTVEEAVLQQIRRRKCNWFSHILRSDDIIAKQALWWTLQCAEKEGDPGTLGKAIRARNVDNRLQIQLEKDGGGSTRQSWVELSGLWPVLHWELSQVLVLVPILVWVCAS